MRRLAATFLLGALACLSVPAAADSTPTPTAPSPEAPLQVVVTELLPRAPQAHDAVEVTGYVKNVGSTPVTGVLVRLKVGDRITTRGGLHDADRDRPFTSSRESAEVSPAQTTLAPGALARFDLRTTLDHLQINRLGVYPVDVEARGNAGKGIEESLGLAPTWIPFFAENPQPTRIAVLWPLVDQPHQGTDSTLLDDTLATRLLPSGRLGGLLDAARGAEVRDCGRGARGPKGTQSAAPSRCEPVPVTYAVDPDLLTTASTMARPYKVRAGDKTVDGTGTGAAAAWLARLREGVGGTQVLALPYADPDLTALTRTSGGRDDVALASLLGRTTVSNVLHTAPLEGIAWPPAGPVTQAASDALARSGARSFVLDASAYVQPDSEPYPTPSARTVLTTSTTGSELDGLVADTYLSALVTGPSAAQVGPRLAEQRFLAETAIISAEGPNLSGTLVIAPDRRTEVSSAAATAALRDLGRVPWLCPVSLGSAAGNTERCAGQANGPVARPVPHGDLRTDRSGELAPSYLSGIAADRDEIAQLTDAILSDRQDPAIRDAVARTKERLRQAVARAESSAWRGNDAAAGTYAGLVHAEVARLRGKIVVRGGRVLLTSSKGTLQVSIENTLDVPVDVRVRFSSKTATLPVGETGLVDVTPGHAVQAGVKAEAQRSGQFVVFAQIVDRNGKPFGPEAEIIVRSTRFGRLALAVTAAGAGVLLVAAGVRIVRRALRSR